MSNRNDEEAVARVRDTSESVVPGQECGEKSEETPCFDDALGWSATGVLEEANAEKEEGHVEGEEEEEESDGGLQGADKEDRGKDEPALTRELVLSRKKSGSTYHQVKTKGVEEAACAVSIYRRRFNFEATRREDDGKREPETAVR